MNKKQILASAVATALVAPFAAFAAIDEQGMAYVSAGEGLSGSLRHDILIDVNAEGKDSDKKAEGAEVSSKTNSLRLYLAGDLDLGGGLKSSYYYEVRDGDGSGSGGLNTHAYDIGLKGPFGSFSVGDLGMVAPRMVPSADLAFERGTNRKSFAADPGPNGLRYESPVINGFQFGVSGVLNGSEGDAVEVMMVKESEIVIVETAAVNQIAVVTVKVTNLIFGKNNGHPAITTTVAADQNLPSLATPLNKESLDEFSLAVKYTLPIGLVLGAGYESKKNNVPEDANFYGNIAPALATLRSSSATLTLTEGNANLVRSGGDLNGFRFGARYSQDNWLVGYEYRSYDSFSILDSKKGLEQEYFEGDQAKVAFTYTTALQVATTTSPEIAAATVAITVVDRLAEQIIPGDAGLEYNVHAFGVMATVDRVVLTAGYSIEENEYKGKAADKYLLERDTIALDAAYKLGSKSTMVVGWKKEDYSADVTLLGLNARGSTDVSTTYLFYRIDF